MVLSRNDVLIEPMHWHSNSTKVMLVDFSALIVSQSTAPSTLRYLIVDDGGVECRLDHRVRFGFFFWGGVDTVDGFVVFDVRVSELMSRGRRFLV